MANTGGLLGLCMGFSLVSAFEILYHLLISICKYIESRVTSDIFNLRGAASQATALVPDHYPQLLQQMPAVVVSLAEKQTEQDLVVDQEGKTSLRTAKLVVCRKLTFPHPEKPVLNGCCEAGTGGGIVLGPNSFASRTKLLNGHGPKVSCSLMRHHACGSNEPTRQHVIRCHDKNSSGQITEGRTTCNRKSHIL